MPKFSQKSKDKLKGVHPLLVDVVNEAIKHVDFTVIEGVRSYETQEEYVRTGKSKTMDSKHLMQQDGYGHALDLALYPVNWSDRDGFIALSYFIRGIAAAKGIKIRQGVDWDGDFNIKEHSFFDGPHVELKLNIGE